MLIHGARAALVHAHRQPAPDRLRDWALRLERTAGSKRASVALANKIARIVWAVPKQERDFSSAPIAA